MTINHIVSETSNFTQCVNQITLLAGWLGLLFLHGDFGQLFSDPLVDLEVFCHAPVDAHGLALLQVGLAVLGRHALLVAGVR